MYQMFVYVEGNYDKMFVKNILSDYLRTNKSILLYPIPYAQKPPNEMNKDIKSKSKHNYLFLSDLDIDKFPCITSRKEKRINTYEGLESSKIIIVKAEIESWYLAGVDNTLSQFKNFDIPDNTESVTKEEFDSMIGECSKFDMLMEISKCYDFKLARKRNSSFNYFMNKISNYF